jgi:hypothetical protein
MAMVSAGPKISVGRAMARWLLPWLCSTTAHTALLLGMVAVYQWVRDAPSPGVPAGTGLHAVFIMSHGADDSMGVDADGDDPSLAGSRYYDDEPAPPAQKLAEPNPGGGVRGGGPLSSLLNDKPLISLAGVLPTLGEGSGVGALEGGGVGTAAGLTTQPRGSNQVRRGYARTGVFGISGEGHKFVYVFDRSGSMDGHGGAPLTAAKMELLASLKDLNQVHQFQIIFYNEHPRVFNPTGSPGKLVFGTDQNKYLAQKFIGSITADGATRHEEALAMAVRMSPDVIFFLTDADEPRLTSAQLAHIAQLNKGTSINAIEFGYGPQSDADNFLVKLARQNGGKHAYVDISQLPVARR